MTVETTSRKKPRRKTVGNQPLVIDEGWRNKSRTEEGIDLAGIGWQTQADSSKIPQPMFGENFVYVIVQYNYPCR